MDITGHPSSLPAEKNGLCPRRGPHLGLSLGYTGNSNIYLTCHDHLHLVVLPSGIELCKQYGDF